MVASARTKVKNDATDQSNKNHNCKHLLLCKKALFII